MRKIKNTTKGGLGTFLGPKKDATGAPLEREHVFFAPESVTEIDDAKLAEALKDPIVKGWFMEGLLVEQTPQVAAEVASVDAGDAGQAKAKGAK